MILSEKEKIVANLPYGEGFKFVDKLLELDDDHVVGIYRFREKAYFYKHHFINHPVTPGVLLIECMAQIGLACLGTYLVREQQKPDAIAFTESQVNFLKEVPPDTAVVVSAVKQYFRFNKLKVVVQMRNEDGEKVAEGMLAGMVISK
jgi:3-hydroxyacyl-[acyl-carrier-protein] dehydratase